VKKKTK